jgi:hypothetical protein
MSTKTISRRQLIKRSIFAAIGTSLFFKFPQKAFGSEGNSRSALTKVILVRDKAVVNEDGTISRVVLADMLDKAIINLTGETSIDKAWSKIIKKEDIVGIKTNVWDKLGTPEELEEILKERVMKVGISETNVSINDRGVRNDPVFQKSTALINTRPMRTHAWAGVGSLLKNYIMFAEKPSDYHPDSCADLAKLWYLDGVKGKTKLNVLVMLTPLFHGVGPHQFNKEFVWNYCGLLVGTDPVAVDSTGLRIIEAKRKAYFSEDMPLNPPAKHILLADTRHGLGTADPEKIDLIRLGWEDEIFI